MPKQLSQAVIEQWVAVVKGKFNVRDIWYEVGIETPQNKQYLRVILGRLEKANLVTNEGGGNYRKVDSEAPDIDWQSADPSRTISLKLPFGEHEIAKIYPKSVIIVAGGKNSGKTAYLYNVVAANMHSHNITLYNNETSPEQMHERFRPLNIPNPPPFRTRERYDNFADIIDPDGISVIDYLDMNSELYLVGLEIDKIFRRLRTGVAIIGLQKPPPTVTMYKGQKKAIERDLAYGGGFTAKRCVLYVSMGGGKLKLVYVKTPKNPRINPDNMTFTYRIGEDGIHFTNIQRFYSDDTNV